MRKIWVPAAFLLGWTAAAIAALGGRSAQAQTDVSASVLGSFSTSSNGNGTYQSPSAALGGLFEVRHIAHPLIGFEATYSYNRANEVYGANSYVCPVTTPDCEPPQPQPISANAHEVTVDWVASLKFANLRPFALAGVGGIFTEPASGQSYTTPDAKAVFVYGAGLDMGLLPHFGLRLQYRGNLNKAADLSTVYTSTDAFTRSGQPMVGLYLRL